ncbi:dihydrolipoyl dehydrogenase [Syntrophotalea acetylenica]|jgi:dihydrolipoamide dehydrogenase|uniref:Dihydrolipoyl dehydrogenase n=1 Tax=Syntrophotalea acetylenica TaxID=29542 RepID=A0A1L3GGA8_SYNAC|nr:dihydrolipoyl dehydrogenase [Syntrophotalea acetylenica]APG24937.1 dihydrolipoyl dehydrogenase [Syntrophotalea acetylenica]APG43000.1 dihydrolipoyl dehydrogenase [Syntrophotalea acetylenica]
MADEIFDLIVLGAGPGGYVGAIRAAQLGMKVAVIESRPTLGGVCLNEGCIPSKALLDSSEHFALARDKFDMHGIEIPAPKLNLAKMMARKEGVVGDLTGGVAFLFKKNKVSWIKGHGRLLGAAADGLQQVEVTGKNAGVVKGKNILLATGGKVAQVPGITIDNEVIIDNVGALSLQQVPEHLVVVGAGYIGLELGSVWLRLGAKVSVVEMLPKMLPKSDGDTTQALQRSMKKQGMTFHMGTRVDNIQVAGGKATLTLSKGDKTQEVVCDKVLMSIGRKPNMEGLGASEIGVELDERGCVKVDDNYATTVPGIYAIGDLIPGPMLAHKASEEAVVFVERLVGKNSQVHYGTIPGVCYTWPEVASVGKTEEQLQEEGIPVKVGKFNFVGNGRARAMAETEGFVKILAHAENGQVLGVHIFGPRASDMIAEAVAVMSYGGTAHDIGAMFHGHPTLSEAVKEAALDVDGAAVHC